ncbi:MAG: biotin--[acetyl-CoA-carboxylase] ligase [Lachnospiraceae bacterium]|nr:biotin--[acetyl-CoA-carboxylase] ligase [Lachnospiraceae bacterium]
MSDRLLEIFNSSEEYVSGQEIADKLGISRNAVWKTVQKARKEGYEIEAVPRRGYRLVNSGEAFGVNSIRNALKTRWLGKELVFMEEVDSTNEECKRRSRKGAGEGLVVIADSQSAGKGRRGRGWSSEKGTTISMSYLLKPDFSPDIAPMLTLIMAMAAAEGISRVTGIDVGIKWPNDIVINGKKAVGILTEMTAEPDYIQEVVIGTGINVTVKEFPEAIRDTATSLYLETGKIFSRAQIAGEITTSFEIYYERFVKEGNLSRLTNAYNALCVNTGKRVRVLDPKGEYEAEAVGINERGELLVETDSGEVNNIYSGEVSVRGIYGYI